MMGLFIIAFVGFVIAIGFGGYLYYRRRVRAKAIAGILDDPNSLARWTYTPDEWRTAVAGEFSWAKASGSSAQIFISRTGIYVKTDTQDHLIELANGFKVVTYASYRGEAGSPLKLRVRWKVVRRNPDGPDETKYYKEDYRIPVPLKHKQAAQNVADYFTAQLENNLAPTRSWCPMMSQ